MEAQRRRATGREIASAMENEGRTTRLQRLVFGSDQSHVPCDQRWISRNFQAKPSSLGTPSIRKPVGPGGLRLPDDDNLHTIMFPQLQETTILGLEVVVTYHHRHVWEPHHGLF